MQTNGKYTFTPPTDFVGVDSFLYVVCDDGTPSLCDTNICVIRVINTPKPSIGVAMTASEPVPTSEEAYDVTFTITVKNYGDIDLKNVRVVENIANVFTTPAEYSIIEVITGGSFVANPNFNGINPRFIKLFSCRGVKHNKAKSKCETKFTGSSIRKFCYGFR
jgi:uncharacterized repeat protein (TIGR01451 family)